MNYSKPSNIITWNCNQNNRVDTCTCIQHICNLSMIQSTLDEKTCLHHNSCTLSYSHHSSAMSTDDHFRTRLFVGSLLGWFLCTRQKWQPSWGINIASSRVIKRIFHMIYIILTFTKSNRTRNYIFFLSIFRGDQCTVSRIYSNVLNYKEDFFFLESNEYFDKSQEMKLMMLSKTDIFRANGEIKRNFDQNNLILSNNQHWRDIKRYIPKLLSYEENQEYSNHCNWKKNVYDTHLSGKYFTFKGWL